MKFSIIVLGYNQEAAICTTLSDALAQTHRDIEVIYVDDCSTDGSAARVERELRDPRLRIIRHGENSGPFLGRLHGIEAATGDYLLLLDGDDSLAPNACETLARVLTQQPRLDLVGFGVELLCEGAVDRDYLADMERRFALPVLGQHSGAALGETIFLQGEMPYNLWNKCYAMPLAKTVAAKAAADKLYYNEDFYFTFMACACAETYLGISDKLYRYRVGQGISTAAKASMGSFTRSLTACRSNRHCADFARDAGLYDTYRAPLEANLRNNLLGAYYKLATLPAQERPTAAKLLFDTYGTEYTISTLAAEFWYDRHRVAPNLCLGQVFPFPRRPVRTVAMFYPRLYNGGIERVVTLLAEILSQRGYKVVVITNEEESPNDYALPAHVQRVCLGMTDEGRSYAQRFRAWHRCIRDCAIDAVVYHAWLDDSLLWDLCAVKSAGAALIAHTHTACTAGLYGGWAGISMVQSTLACADGVVTLSEADSLYWSRLCPNVHTVTNPLTFSAADRPAAPLTGHKILWLSRFDYAEKNPEDPLHILQRVLRYVPDATLTMVGSMDDPLRAHFERLIADMGLAGHVELAGYTTDVGPHYQAAAVHLMTPNNEGYGMTISESLAYGVPVVTYELPHLRRVTTSRAIVQVPWRDTAVAAEAIAELLIDEDRRREMGAQGREELNRLAQFDFGGAWEAIFRSVETGCAPVHPLNEQAYTELMAAFDLVTRQMCQKQSQLQAELSNLYSAPTGLRKLLRKGKTAVRVLKDKGLAETLRLTKEKIAGK